MIKNNPYATDEATVYNAGYTPWFKDFFCPANTAFGEFLTESANFLLCEPDLTDKIEADLDRHGLEKKRLREADRRFLLERTRAREGFEILPESSSPARLDLKGNELPSKLETLEEGRPRLPAAAVGVLLLIRGYIGSCTDKEALDFMGESKSLEYFLATQGLRLPARSTLSELLNAVSQETRDAIFRAHLARARREGLDIFDEVLIDSTAARANSCWPTDAKIIFVMLKRIVRIGGGMEIFGLENIRPGRLPARLEDLSKLPFHIALNAKKKKKFRKFVREFIQLASKMLCHANKEHERLKDSWDNILDNGCIMPSLRVHAREAVALFSETLKLTSKSLEQMEQRVFDNKKFSSNERVLSVHDNSAAYIQKGGREPVIGYKPQLARSANGFVVGLIVEKGNVSDSASLVPMVKQAIANTGIIPRTVNADDGYSSRAGIDNVEELGVEVISISGSKGKKLLGERWDQEEYRLARANRSAVESLMFCLKHGFDFGQLSRTGLAAAREEFLEKCIAYNICRAIELRKRKRRQQAQAA